MMQCLSLKTAPLFKVKAKTSFLRHSCSVCVFVANRSDTGLMFIAAGF